MNARVAVASCFVVLLSAGSAQTVTGSGTANTVPQFTGTGTSSTVGNSPISILGSNVGIGTASPAAPLHVVGTIRKDFTASVTGGTGYWMLYANDGSANFNEYINSTGTTSPTAVVQGAGFRRLFSPEPTGTTDTFNYQYANTVAAGSPQSWLDYMTVDATHNYLNLMDHGGNVGVGTTAPIRPLTVYGETSIVPNASNGVNAYLDINDITGSNGGNYSLNIRGLGSNGSVGVNLANINLMAGKVGVGMNGPLFALDVSGQIHTSSGIVFPDSSTQTTAYTAGNSGYLYLSGNTNPTTTNQGTYVGWNAQTGGAGETDFINNPGAGTGGFAFMSVPPSGTPRTTLMFISGTGSVGIGTPSPSATLEVNGTVKIDTTGCNGLTFSGASGTQTTPWTGVLCGGDYAEAVDPAGDKNAYEAGDVLVITDDTEGDVRKSVEPYSTMVAGIFATKPGVVGRRESLPKDAQDLPMAMVGIVPTKVTAENGPIHKGDLLVTSSKPGFAMKGTDRNRMLGAVIGKAMGSLDLGTGVIEVLVTLQ